jgi:hypothetical protein
LFSSQQSANVVVYHHTQETHKNNITKGENFYSIINQFYISKKEQKSVLNNKFLYLVKMSWEGGNCRFSCFYLFQSNPSGARIDNNIGLTNKKD